MTLFSFFLFFAVALAVRKNGAGRPRRERGFARPSTQTDTASRPGPVAADSTLALKSWCVLGSFCCRKLNPKTMVMTELGRETGVRKKLAKICFSGWYFMDCSSVSCVSFHRESVGSFAL